MQVDRLGNPTGKIEAVCCSLLWLLSVRSQLVLTSFHPEMMKVAAFFATIASVSAGALELSPANFDDEVVSSGKGAFVKFLAPW